MFLSCFGILGCNAWKWLQFSCGYLELGMYDSWNGNVQTTLEPVWRGAIYDIQKLFFKRLLEQNGYVLLCLFQQVAALFKIASSKEIPYIPESLSNDAKSFIKLCLQREPSARPIALELLNHPFIQDQATTRVANMNVTKDAFPFMFDGSRTPVMA